MNRPFPKFAKALILAVGLALTCSAQPSLQEVWKRHDAFAQKVIGEGDGKAKLIAVSEQLFVGKAGNKVRGWDSGNVNAPAILWWGGGPGSTFDLAYLWKEFENPSKFRHMGIDQPGTGESQWLEGWAPETTVDDAEAFLVAQGIHGPVLVAGWSWGSTMAILFAQRHPERVRGIVVGGVWSNTAEEVESYLGVTGTRAWLPSLSMVFKEIQTGGGTARALHAAIRAGQGGKDLAKAYNASETLQCQEGELPRKLEPEVVVTGASVPVNMATEQDSSVRFAYIESEMMSRGECGQWSLGMRFPEALAAVPLVVLQGRYDQVCLPKVAMTFLKAWPGTHKLLVPFNGGHWGFDGPDKAAREKCGLVLTPKQERQLALATALHFGNDMLLIGAALDSLGETAIAY